MDAEKRATWVAALRSGKYTQGRGLLRDNADRMCCLGVAINEFCPQRWARIDGAWQDGEADRYLPSDWSRHEALDLSYDECSELATLNDEYALSFNEIANHIERHGDNLAQEFDERDREHAGSSSRTDR